ncbi:MAG: LmbE family protein, partial [Sphingobacterium sp.]
LHGLIKALQPGNYQDYKLKEIEDIILQSAGLLTESNTSQANYVIGQPAQISDEIIVRNPGVKVRLIAIDQQVIKEDLPHNETRKYVTNKTYDQWTQPFWLENPHTLGKFQIDENHFGLAENPNKPGTVFQVEVAGLPIQIKTPTAYKYVDPVEGEIHQPIVVSPKFVGRLESNNVLLKNGEGQSVRLRIKNQSTQQTNAQLSFENLEGFVIAIDEQEKNISLDPGQEISKTIQISNPNNRQKGDIKILLNGEPLYFDKHIAYKHIPEITWFENLTIRVHAMDLVNPVKKIAFIPGAGDLIPSSLENIGIKVDQISEEQINPQTLQQYDAVILGVRAFNINKQIAQWQTELLSYVQNGGTVLVQYNVSSPLATDKLGPYPFVITRDRVTQEDSPVKFLLPEDPALNYPNKITPADFQDWIQERGLYFATEVDDHYRTPLALADENEQAHPGSLLISNYGKGKFVYTSISFFRQLPAGIPGAYRLFVNLLAKEEK